MGIVFACSAAVIVARFEIGDNIEITVGLCVASGGTNSVNDRPR